MNRAYKLGVIGADARTRALAERLGPSSPFAPGPVILRAWGPSPAGGDEAEASAQATVGGAWFSSRWHDVLPAVDAIFVGGRAVGRADAVVAGLEAGKAVVCPLPLAKSAAELDRIEAALAQAGGTLLTPTDLRFTLAGAEALEQVAAGEIGRIHGIWAASRRQIPAAGSRVDLLDELGWELLDYVAACAGGPVQRVYAAEAENALLLTLRFRGDLIATVELGRTLPREFSAPDGEVELDLTGETGVLRVEPYRHAVTVTGGSVKPGAERRAWHPHPVVEMLEELERAMGAGSRDGSGLARARSVLALMEAVRESVRTGEAIGLEGAR